MASGCLLVGGCALRVPSEDDTPQAMQDAADDWREAVVVGLGDALPDRGTVDDDCRMAPEIGPRVAGGIGGANAAAVIEAFAEVAYRQGRRSRLRIVLLDRDRDGVWAIGDDAFIDLRDCRRAAIRRSNSVGDANPAVAVPATTTASGATPAPGATALQKSRSPSKTMS